MQSQLIGQGEEKPSKKLKTAAEMDAGMVQTEKTMSVIKLLIIVELWAVE